MKITRHENARSIDVKRLNLPYTVTDPCPKCGHKCVRDLSRDPTVSYPTPREEIDLYGYCDECDHEWPMNAVFDVTLTTSGKKTLTVELTEDQLLAVQLGQYRNGEKLGDTLLRMAGLLPDPRTP